MSRLVRSAMADANVGWGNSGSAARDNGRRNWVSTAWLMAGTIIVAVTSYSLSLKVAGERREVERMASRNAGLAGELKALDAELRVRMRMPQLQRWNDGVLGMVPISATQYLGNPMQLADYGKLPEAARSHVQLAVRDEAPAVAANTGPLLVRADVPVAGQDVVVSTQPAIRRPQPLEPVVRQASASAERPEAAPADLLRQVEMTFGSADGANR